MAAKVGGRIVRIKLKGFMTYDDLEIIPVKGLNLILGLNGSGKSSIMCAICLGLGGKPRFTGRSLPFSDFIKFNHTEAIIEIELESLCGRNDVISHFIHADKNLWHLNNKPVNQSEITLLVRKYNIDMGNLCQFLPQEKVAEFSKMDRNQRLVNMIQSMGDPSLVTLFGDLKELRNNFVRREKELEELENNKASEQTIYDRLKLDINSQEDRMTLEQDLKLYKLQKMGFEYSYLIKEIQERKVKIEERKNEKLEIEKQIKKLQAENHYATEFHVHQTKIEELKGELCKFIQNLTNCCERLRGYHEEVDDAKICFENRMKEKTEQMDQLAHRSKLITASEDHLRQKKNNKLDLEEKLRQMKSEHENLKKQLSSCESQMGNLSINKKALESKKLFKEKEIKSYEDKKYDVLREKYSDTYEALQWLQHNESSFKSRISYPSLISINVQSDAYRKFIENTVAVRDLLMFVCEDKDDLERFLNIMKHQKKLSVNASMVPDETLADFASQPITEHMRNLGIKCYLKDLFTAPDPVMRYLCKLNRVHLLPVCSKKAENDIDSILEYNSLFFTPSERIYGKRSHYGQQSMSVKRDYLVCKNILPSMKDNFAKTELQEIEKSLEELRPQFDSLERQKTDLEKQQERLRNEENGINVELRNLNELKTKLAQLWNSYKRLEKDIINEEEEKKKAKDMICNLNNKKLETLTEMQKIIKEILKLKEEKVFSIIYMKRLNEKITSLEEQISTESVKLNSKKSDLSKLEQERVDFKDKAKKLHQVLQEAREAAADKEKIKALFASPIGLDEIEHQISCIEAKLELTKDDSEEVMAEYKKREHTLLNMEKKINSLISEIDVLKTEIEEKKNIWLPPLRIRIETVNKKFSEYYKILKCAGEISLDQTDDTDDFPNYGLQIKLKYRVDDDFMELSPTHYSGGECSVATIIFILSLQDLIDVPFRCIDEINQGMDTVNERKIYQLVADAAENGSCCQYFLLSPKLLLDLSYQKDVAVHIIFNSPFLRANLNVKEDLKIKKSLM